MSNVTKGIKFQRGVYAFLRVVVGWFFTLKINAHYKRKKIKSKTFLVLCNHTLATDPLYLIITLRRHAKFVASSNIMEGFGGWFVKNLAGPIPRVRGASADDTVELIEENLKNGISVAMFPEGSRTWDGETGYISGRTAELLKESGVALVTVRTSGGYLIRPRWSKHRRYGRMDWEVVNEYSPEEIEKLSLDEINEIIGRDLYINVFEDLKNKNYNFRGKNTAEGIEMIAYICPKCRKIGNTYSEGDFFGCKCGLRAKYHPNGFIETEEGMPQNTLEWNCFQKKFLRDNAEELRSQTAEPITMDDRLSLTIAGKDGSEKVFSEVTLLMYGDRVEFVTGGNTTVLRMDEIEKAGMFRSKRVFFSTASAHYRFLSDTTISGVKYFALWRVLSGKEYY